MAHATWTSVATGVSKQTVAAINQLIAARNEREAILGDSGDTSALVAPDNLQVKTTIYNLQTWCEDNSTNFADIYNGTGSKITNYDNTDDVLVWTRANFKTAIAGDADGWRRQVTWGVTVYGKAVVGDIIDSWLITDLQKAFGLLVWRRIGTSWSLNGATNNAADIHNYVYNEPPAMDGTIWNTESGIAEARWADNLQFGTVNSTPSVWYLVKSTGPTNYTFIWQMQRLAMSQAVPGVWPGFTPTVEFYINSRIPDFDGPTIEGTFDANNEDLIEDKFSLWETQINVATGGSFSSTDIGSDGGAWTQPIRTIQNSAGFDNWSIKGWQTTSSMNQYAIARFDLASGGFIYW